MDWRRATRDEEGRLAVPASWLLPHYYEALTVLFRFENALRMLVYLVLKCKEQEKWGDLNISSDEGQTTTISALAKKRHQQDLNFGYLGYDAQSPLLHLTGGELARLITTDAQWPLFKEYFPAKKEVISWKLQEVSNVRNALAHFRPIKPDDVEVAKQNANQVLSVIERTLVDVLRCADTVPTNSSEEWYKRLATIGNEYLSFSYHQSPDTKWVCVRAKYTPRVLSGAPRRKHGYLEVRATTVDSHAFLGRFAGLRGKLLFLTETARGSKATDEKVSLVKQLNLTFPRQVLVKSSDEIAADLEALVLTATNETELLGNDQLARGEIVRAVSVTGSIQKFDEIEYWSLNTSSLTTPQAQNNEQFSEHWGAASFPEPDFVSNTTNYPWMPGAIATEELPW